MAVTRENLFEQVWSEPMTKLAARHGVSSRVLAQVCERLNIPRPTSGHWDKARVGRAPPLPALPPASPGDDTEWNGKSLPKRAAAAEKRTVRDAVVPTPTGKPPSTHRLIEGVASQCEKVYPHETGYLRPRKRDLVDVFVSKPTLQHALRFASELFLALERRGHSVALASKPGLFLRPEIDVRETPNYHYMKHWTPDRATIAHFDSVAIGLTIFEPAELVDVERVDDRYVRFVGPPKRYRGVDGSLHTWDPIKNHMPSGRLTLVAYSAHPGTKWERRWTEDKPGTLAKQCDEIVHALERTRTHITKLIEEAEREAAIQKQKFEAQQREWERREAERRKVEEEAARVKRLDEEVRNWKHARDIRDYVAATHDAVASIGWKVRPGGQADVWLKWALARADELDPISKIRDAINQSIAEEQARVKATMDKAGVTEVATDAEPEP